MKTLWCDGEATMTKLLFSHFLEVHPPSVNVRLRKGRYGNIYSSSEYKDYVESVLLQLKVDLGRDTYTLPEKTLYRIDLFFLGDWYDSISLITRGHSIKEAVGCCGTDKPDLDNLFKVCIDAVKVYVQNDDKFTNEVHGYKILHPQRPGTIVQVSRGRLWEVSDLEGIVPAETLVEVRKPKVKVERKPPNLLDFC